jgi:hypothetical protein
MRSNVLHEKGVLYVPAIIDLATIMDIRTTCQTLFPVYLKAYMNRGGNDYDVDFSPDEICQNRFDFNFVSIDTTFIEKVDMIARQFLPSQSMTRKSIRAIVTFPGAVEQRIHRDGEEEMFSILLPLQDQEGPEMGCTQFFHGTHIKGVKPSKSETPIQLAGDAFIFCHSILHRGTANISKSHRFILCFSYGTPDTIELNYRSGKRLKTEQELLSALRGNVSSTSTRSRRCNTIYT